MVALTWALISFCSGLLAFIAIPAIASTLAMDIRLRVGRYCYKSCMKIYGQAAIAWRSLGGPELKPLKVNDEEGLARVVLSSGTLGDDKVLPFEDYDNRIHRLQGKPLAVIPEIFPAAVDAELAEVSHWFEQHAQQRGFETDDGVDPFLPMSDGLRAAHPFDVLALAPKGIKPENIETAKKVTKNRFSKYGGMPGAVEAGATMLAFAVGAGAVMGMVYVRQEVLGIGGGGGGGPSGVPLPPGMIADVAVQTLGVIPL